MLRWWATSWKEWIVLSRDRGGLAIIFIMPALLLIVMAQIQNAPFRDFQEKQVPVLLADQDRDTLGASIRKGLKGSPVFIVQEAIDGEPLTKKKVRELTRKGKYKIGVVIPERATERVRKKASDRVAQVFGMEKEEDSDTLPVTFTLFFDPVTKSSFKSSVRHSLDKFVTDVGSAMMLEAMTRELKRAFPDMETPDVKGVKEPLFGFREVHPSGDLTSMSINSVQHNVPAWTVFGMFFIVITMAGNMIRERQDGSEFRLRSMSGSYLGVLAGKITAYLAVCLLQCLIMLLVGLLVLPLVGLPAFRIGNDLLGIFVVASCTGLAATGFGTMIGMVFSTHQQASTFGSVAVVVLAAVGGIWVPLYLMPEFLKMIGEWSPLRWGIHSFYGVFVRESSPGELLPELSFLLAFFLGTTGIGYLYDKLKRV